MENKLIMRGHAWNRRFFYTAGNTYCERSVPGGAAMLAAILGDRVCAPELPEDALCEHLQLVAVKREDHFYAGMHAGWTVGNSLLNTGNGNTYVVWDEGFGGIEFPKDGPVLWASRTVLPGREIVGADEGGRLMLMLDADVLRKNGAMISRQVSWEHSATDLVWQLGNNPGIQYLNTLKHILIVFGEDGAIYFKRGSEGIQPVMTLAHGGAEGTLRTQAGGRMPDAWTVMVAGVAAQYHNILQNKALFLSPVFGAVKNLMEKGYDLDTLESGEYGRWFSADFETAKNEEFAIDIPIYDASLGADPYFWRIGSESNGRRIFDMAYNYVIEGDNAIDGLPRLSIGNLTTVDRREIEAFHNIKNLIGEYTAGKAARPLCIAVFGAPGSGKSFGVTQIAKNIMPGLVEKLEFNVSQFAENGDLAAAFHQVRDMVLQGKLPLVFFDEFDSDRDGRPLGWIKNFLMPMQDGKFRDGSGEHPIGKCILVFAGGTLPSFEAFSAPMHSQQGVDQEDTPNESGVLLKTQEGMERARAFIAAKGPDFVSRLRGTINVLGPNPVDDDDQSYILRRALLLRSLCERKLPQKTGRLFIDENVIKAMLLVPKYKHGARSMESILDMSRLEGATWEPASLPFRTQLDLHVDATVFIRLVLNEVRLESFTEKLAKAAHEDYLQKQSARGEAVPFLLPWEQLPEQLRQENYRQIRLISKKLYNIGCNFDSGDTPFLSVAEFSEEETLLLSRFEHDMWMASRKAMGYEYGLERNDVPCDENGEGLPLTHPDMLPWEELSETARQKDIDTVKNIIPLLQSVGLRVYRTI